MGRGRGKGKKLSLTYNNGDPANEEDKQKGRLEKPLMNEDDEDIEKIEENDDDIDDENASSNVNGNNKRKRDKVGKKKGDLVKEESASGAGSKGFRHVGSRRKNKPHRAAEVGVECT
ncbi:hypothetical protein HanRHA438_Chr02g0094381 [Helianthus annuus]|uniref:Uncharacterized protein n=1 Tax=Helianthus annuus TaxID=4232 RepID=A0A251VIL0_HELAN|nr:hypothetical protein HanXRQr2_Chr02g0082961 [Helianthus annuus]KAJ0606012.1 hypothetical protein HanHA300_Chr02g0069381 [Helianthus annuus]KAJ0616936.1 hypothetical protein HanIR_Chr02g0096001 [Helianthus annuus]KAJ0620009.1 hypothetical protein HanHA89_Chr02g0077651 [Helianthus annuus]KAJ0778469.1 hypothetical protein HanLR1_Chr02g0072041 [Helianthus annuus]